MPRSPYSSRHLNPFLTKPTVSPAILLWVQHSNSSYYQVSDEALLETSAGATRWKLAAFVTAVFCIGIAIGQTLPNRSNVSIAVLGETLEIPIREKQEMASEKKLGLGGSGNQAITAIPARSSPPPLSDNAAAKKIPPATKDWKKQQIAHEFTKKAAAEQILPASQDWMRRQVAYELANKAAAKTAYSTGEDKMKRQLANEFWRTVRFASASYNHHRNRLANKAPSIRRQAMRPSRQHTLEFRRSIGDRFYFHHIPSRTSTISQTVATNELHSIARLAMIKLENGIGKKKPKASSGKVSRSPNTRKTTLPKMAAATPASRKSIGQCPQYSAAQGVRYASISHRCRSWRSRR